MLLLETSNREEAVNTNRRPLPILTWGGFAWALVFFAIAAGAHAFEQTMLADVSLALALGCSIVGMLIFVVSVVADVLTERPPPQS
jgi:cbb3-type cytochrome oxidase subunit 1